jgi:D-3-phosphoglycerate dehydrogenase / 2-oxoglutarate reductase
MYKIKALNPISDLIHDILSADRYTVSSQEPTPDAILVRSAPMLDMPLPPSLLAVARAGAGVNNIPVDACSQAGIVVFNTPGANANAVAELVMGGLLLAGRDVAGGLAWVETLKGQPDIEKQVEKGKGKFTGPELRGKTLGVIGLGAVGALVANAAANGFGMEVMGFDPGISVEHAWSLSRAIRRAADMDEIFKKSDFISLHVPLMDATRGMVNASVLQRMKKGARLLNFSRAELVNAADVKAALASCRLSAYITDFPTMELVGEKGIVCIPHLGASTPESEDNCAQMAAAELKDYLERGIIRNSVNMPDIGLGVPEGSRVVIIHENVPGLVSGISTGISARGINIQNMLNKSRGSMAVTVLELSQSPDADLARELSCLPGVARVRLISGEMQDIA